jgi:hypothetical protein
MCDFSLEFVASRPARVGDKLVSTRFDNSFTRGFAAVGEPGVAVCLLPGTELAFQKPVECKRGFGVLPNLVIAGAVARFRQINMDKLRAHHDALEFPNGQIVLLHNLVEGQHTSVLQLPVKKHDVNAVDEVRMQNAAG